MKLLHDPETDTLTIALREDARVAESREIAPGVVADLDAGGDVIALEILDASTRVSDPNAVTLELVSDPASAH